MLNMYLLSIIMIFCVFGIYFFIKEITSALLKSYTKTKIMMEICSDADDAERMVRAAAAANPRSEIFITDKSDDAEVTAILKKLSQDDCRIHITN